MLFATASDPMRRWCFWAGSRRSKDPTSAIEVARRTGHKLVLAGNVPEEHRRWFETRIAPARRRQTVRYVAPVDDVQKSRFWASARALLMPILWDEPFGIVMAEAMACGAPVVGFRRGAVPEVVAHGETGFVVDTTDEMIAAIDRIAEIARAACRAGSKCSTATRPSRRPISRSMPA